SHRFVPWFSIVLGGKGEIFERNLAKPAPQAEIARIGFGTVYFKLSAEMLCQHPRFPVPGLQGINVYFALPPVRKVRHIGKFYAHEFVPLTKHGNFSHTRARNGIGQCQWLVTSVDVPESIESALVIGVHYKKEFEF